MAQTVRAKRQPSWPARRSSEGAKLSRVRCIAPMRSSRITTDGGRRATAAGSPDDTVIGTPPVQAATSHPPRADATYAFGSGPTDGSRRESLLVIVWRWHEPGGGRIPAVARGSVRLRRECLVHEAMPVASENLADVLRGE